MDNEIRVVPKVPLSDAAIERKSREVVETDERFRAARALIRVNNGEVFLTGSLLGFHDPSILKHEVADIEGVVGIGVGAAFVARPSET